MGTRPEGGQVLVRAGTPADAGFAASLHTSQISEGFLPRLGTRFLGRLYRRISESCTSFLLIAEIDGQPIGFLAGTESTSGLYKEFALKDGFAAALASAPRLMLALPRVIETLRHGTRAVATTGRVSELLSVAVDPAAEGRGAGSSLITEFVTESRRRGIGRAHVVVGASNSRAVSVYERAGFAALEEFELHPGVGSLLMERAL